MLYHNFMVQTYSLVIVVTWFVHVCTNHRRSFGTIRRIPWCHWSSGIIWANYEKSYQHTHTRKSPKIHLDLDLTWTDLYRLIFRLNSLDSLGKHVITIPICSHGAGIFTNICPNKIWKISQSASFVGKNTSTMDNHRDDSNHHWRSPKRRSGLLALGRPRPLGDLSRSEPPEDSLGNREGTIRVIKWSMAQWLLSIITCCSHLQQYLTIRW